MRIKQLVSMLFLAHVAIVSNVLLPSDSYADTRQIQCTDWDNADARSCVILPDQTPLKVEDLRGLITDLNDINECKTQLEASGSCDVSSFDCALQGDNGISCSIKGVSAPIFNVSCTDFSTNNVLCSITNEIGGLSAALLDTSSNVGSLLTAPQALFGSTFIDVCSNHSNVSSSLQADCDLFIALLDDAQNGNADSAAKAAELLDAITPDGASAALDASQTVLRGQNRNIAQRINELRRAAKASEKLSFNGLQIRSHGKLVAWQDLYPELHTELVEATGGGASADTLGGRLGFFLNGMIDGGEKDTTDNERGFSFSGGEFTTGVDYRFRDNMFAGMAFGFSSNSTDLNDNRGSLDSTNYNLIVYGSVYPADNSYVDANVIVGGGQYDQTRNIKSPANNIDQVASAKYFGDQFSVSLSTGHDFVRGGLTMSPYGTYMYMKSQTDDYNEAISDVNAPGAGFALKIDEQDYTSSTLALGGSFTYAFNYGWGVLVPQTKLEWVKEFEDDIHVVTGNFIGDPNKKQFRLPTDKPDDTYFLFGLGTSGIIPGGQTFYAYYQTYLGYEGLSYYSLNVGIRWEIE